LGTGYGRCMCEAEMETVTSAAMPLPPIKVGSGFLATRAQTGLNLRMESVVSMFMPIEIRNPLRMES
jgi:hypothetical protein